jgi:transposase-like protein
VERAFWDKIAQGLTSEDAAVAVGVSGPVGTRWFRQRGGMSADVGPVPPSGRYLSFAEREEIALLRAQGGGVREIARRIGRAPSTVSRELRRNAATRGGRLEYRASIAQWKAERAARRPKTAKLVVNDRLRSYVQDRLGGQVSRPGGTPVLGPLTAAWKGRNKPRRQDRRWATA